MKKKFRIGKIGNLDIYLKKNVLMAAIVLLAVYPLTAHFLLNYDLGKSLLAGSIAVLAHYASELIHQLGHHRAATKTGYPMIGIVFLWVLAYSLYPKDEPELPAEIHLKRAYGGPIASFLLSLLFAIFAYLFIGYNNMALDLFIFISGLNMIVFCLGALLPLGFTDGSTILYWWPKRGK